MQSKMNKNILVISLFSSFSLISYAQQTTTVNEIDLLTESINVSTDSLANSALTQEQIDKLDETTRILLADYQSTSKEYESLKLYNDQVQKIINSQIEEIANILFQIDELDKTNQKIVPLMIKMINGLEDFINLDVPFLMNERQDRLANLRTTMDRGDISTSEKFRLIIEAYKTELEYGRTIESYRDNIVIEGVETSADFLRIGRIALTYLTVDGSKGGYWDTNNSSWEEASSSIKRSTADALKVATKQAPPALIKIPVYRNNDE
jgi:uncharacterized protein YccT (UPF0319 family)